MVNGICATRSINNIKKKVRIIGRLDVKAPFVVKGIQMEGLRKLGAPNDFAVRYYEEGVDEIVYIDIVASLYDRNSLLDIVTKTTENVFVPITVGGGIRNVENARQLLRAGADKIAINTAAIKNPHLISELAETFGSQCVVVSIHAKCVAPGAWEVYYDSGRERTGMNVIDWVKQTEEKGAGEILITSVDRDGTQKGCDNALIKAVTSAVKVPVIASGGIGNEEHILSVVQEGQPDAVAIASALHNNNISIQKVRSHLNSIGFETRHVLS